jgi:preprotein translocase subunit SecE
VKRTIDTFLLVLAVALVTAAFLFLAYHFGHQEG